MRKFKKGDWIILYVGFAIVFASLPVSPLAAQKDFVEETPGWMETSIQEQKAEQESVFRSKFENLPAEYQERARRLGYKEGDMVEMRRDSSGALIVLPPLKESKTPGQMREKLNSLITGKIAREMTDDVKITAMLALDGTGHFTIRLKFEALYKELQAQAKKLGFRKGNTVEVQVDAATWKYRVLPKEKKAKFSGNVQEIIPPEEPGGSPSYRMTAMYSVLPKDLKKSAKKMGYGKKDTVRFIYREDTKEYKILPPPLKFGIRYSFRQLNKKEQDLALRIGYKKGDTVWKTFDSKWKTRIVSAAKAGSGPLLEVSEDVLLEQEGGVMKPILQCAARFEVLDLAVQQLARERGHEEGDKVRLNYDIRAGKFEIKSSGKASTRMNADAYIDRGLSYSKKGLYDKAMSDYNRAIELDPKNARAYLYRATVYQRQSMYFQFEKPVSDYTKVIKLDPQNSIAYANRGALYHTKGLYEKAVSDFTKVIEIKPEDGYALYCKASSYEGADLINKALEAYKAVIQNALPKDASYIEKAKKKIKELEERIKKLRKRPSISINEAGEMLKRRNFFTKQYNWNKVSNPRGDFANEYEVKTISGDKVVLDHATGLMWHQSGSEKPLTFKKAKLWVNRLNSRRYAGYSDWKLPTLEEGASLIERSRMNNNLYIDPLFSAKQGAIWTNDAISDYSSQMWLIYFGSAILEWQNVGDVRSHVRPVRSEFKVQAAIKPPGIRKKPVKAPVAVKKPKAEVDADAYIKQGYSYYKKDLYDQAIADYNKAIEIAPKYAKSYLYRGLAYDHKDLYEKAISDYTKAIEIDPKYTVAYRNRANSCLKEHLYDEAISDYIKAIELEPRTFNVGLYIDRGTAYEQKGLYDEAISDYTKVIKVIPNYYSAYINRGLAYDHKGLYDEAISDYTKVIEINPKHYVLAFYYKASSYEKAGRINEALEAYKAFIQNTPPNKHASYIEKAKKKIEELEK